MKYDESDLLEILRYVRHDYLNELQIIKANIALKRMDRVDQIINEIVSKAKNEAKLTNLHVPKFTMLLLGYNWQPRPFKLEIEVTGNDVELSAYDETLYNMSEALFQAFEGASDHFSDNIIAVTIHSNDESFKMNFCYSGKIINQGVLMQNLDRLNQTYHFVEKYIQEDEAVITFQLTDHLR